MLYGHRALVWLFRLGIFIGLLSAVVTVIYLTPFPELYHASCQRPCHELDWPMICRVKLSLESHQILGSWCGDCPNNLTDCDRHACLTADGSSRRVLSANRQLPGPAIQVCENDILVVDVTNKLTGQGVAVHWRGQSQRGTPYMDGVAMVTQCPIPAHTTFQYKFRASQAGTHLWQVHTGDNLLDGLFGPFIVRQADRREVHRQLFDIDDPNHYVVINEWSTISPLSSSLNDDDVTSSPSLLINGRSYSKTGTGDRPPVPFSRFNITTDKRHRLRFAYVGGNLGCPVSVQIEKHRLLVIAIDGNPVAPKDVESIILAPGERIDCILTADKEENSYWMEAKTRPSCHKQASSFALFTYLTDLSSTVRPITNIPEEQTTNKHNVLTTVTETECLSESNDYLCLQKITSLNKLPIDLAADKLDLQLYLMFDFVNVPRTNDFPEDTVKPRVNNITFMFPSSPLVSQFNDLEDSSVLCNSNKRPIHCAENSTICECVHVIDIPLHSRVELILIDKGGDSGSQHIFHVHGGSVYVIGSKPGVGTQTLESIKKLNAQDRLVKKNLKDPLLKDTISVPPLGVVVVRFRADNPGYWLLHDQKSAHWSQGLDVILHIGNNDDLPPVPENFPRCGSWVGPEYFLI